MPIVSGSFVVAAPIALAFELTNRPDVWPEANPLVKGVKVLEREGNKATFEMQHADGRSWQTALFSMPEQRVSYSERMEPKPPLRCMQYVRTYRALSDRETEITERVRFELLEGADVDEASAIERMRAHMVEVQPHIKQHVEAQARAAAGGE